MRHLSLACLTVMDVEPPEAVAIAHEVGYQGVSLAVGNRFLPAGMRTGAAIHSVTEDAALRRATLQRSSATGVTLDLLEGLVLSAAFDPSAVPQVLDVAQELGIPRLATFDADPDRERARDCLADLCMRAQQRGLAICIEFHSHSYVRTAAEAAALIGTGQFPGLGLLVDALHLARGHGTPADITRLDPNLVACAQFCDGPADSPDRAAYRHEAMFERLAPGDGDLPLMALLEAIPVDRVIYLEVPMKTLRDLGVSAKERARRAIVAMRRLERQASEARRPTTPRMEPRP